MIGVPDGQISFTVFFGVSDQHRNATVLRGGSFLRTMGSIRSISIKASSVFLLGTHVDVPQSKLDVCLSAP